MSMCMQAKNGEPDPRPASGGRHHVGKATISSAAKAVPGTAAAAAAAEEVRSSSATRQRRATAPEAPRAASAERVRRGSGTILITSRYSRISYLSPCLVGPLLHERLCA
jgi:hypothetical protein